MNIQQNATNTPPRTTASRRLRRITASAAGGAALALALAACGGGGASSGGGAYAAPATPSAPATSSAAATPSASQTAASVGLRASADGRILVDGKGRTLYLFEADKAGKSACTGGCASAWPPYLSNGTPQAGSGVKGTLLGTSSRTDGGTQVTYGRHPLYFYVGDKAPGDVTGQGLNQFGAKWYVLGQNGKKIDND
jgi:predicted lipoprotein with Yx(FWY)xxD motif